MFCTVMPEDALPNAEAFSASCTTTPDPDYEPGVGHRVTLIVPRAILTDAFRSECTTSQALTVGNAQECNIVA